MVEPLRATKQHEGLVLKNPVYDGLSIVNEYNDYYQAVHGLKRVKKIVPDARIVP